MKEEFYYLSKNSVRLLLSNLFWLVEENPIINRIDLSSARIFEEIDSNIQKLKQLIRIDLSFLLKNWQEVGKVQNISLSPQQRLFGFGLDRSQILDFKEKIINLKFPEYLNRVEFFSFSRKNTEIQWEISENGEIAIRNKMKDDIFLFFYLLIKKMIVMSRIDLRGSKW